MTLIKKIKLLFTAAYRKGLVATIGGLATAAGAFINPDIDLVHGTFLKVLKALVGLATIYGVIRVRNAAVDG